MWLRLRLIFGEAPILFFGVVIGVALTFRAAAGFVREASTPPIVAPTWPGGDAAYVTTGPEPGIASGFVAPERPTSTSTGTSTGAGTGASTTAGVGAAVRAQPVGSPSPPRVTPKPRGHGRRPIHGAP